MAYYLSFPGLGDLAHHDELAGPIVGGFSLIPLGPRGVEWAHSIDANAVVSAATVEKGLLAIVSGPLDLAKRHAAALEALAGTATRYVSEARDMLPPVGGDEGEIIAGLITNLRDAEPRLPPHVFESVDFLTVALDRAEGLNVAPIKALVAELSSVRALISSLEKELRNAAQELAELAERAASREVINDTRRRRVSAKAARAMPKVRAEMQALRDELASLMSRLDSAIALADGAA